MSLRFCAAALACCAALFVAGCTPSQGGKVAAENRVERGGAQLWAGHCRRCHNIRPANFYSDDQWDVVVNHMRIRAGLTGNDARKIVEFLKEAN